MQNLFNQCYILIQTFLDFVIFSAQMTTSASNMETAWCFPHKIQYLWPVFLWMGPIGLRNNNDLISNIHEQTANHCFLLCADYTLKSLNAWNVPSDGAWLWKKPGCYKNNTQKHTQWHLIHNKLLFICSSVTIPLSSYGGLISRVVCRLPNAIVCPRIKLKKRPEGLAVKDEPTGQNVTTAPSHWDSHYKFGKGNPTRFIQWRGSAK